MAQLLLLRRICISNKFIRSHQRKILNFQPFNASSFCTQTKGQKIVENENEDEEFDNDDEDIDLDTLKNEMFEDFESEKEALSNNNHINFQMNEDTEDENEEEMEEEKLSEFNVFDEDKKEKLSVFAQKFKKRIEFNESLKTASKIKSTKSVQYSSSTLNAGIPELMYDCEGVDVWVNYLRLYTYTPFTMGLLFVPLAIYGFPEWELFPKLMLGAFYMSTSAIFPYFSYRAVREKVNRVWLAPDCNKLIIEKKDFFFQPYKREYFIKDLKVLHKKGSDRHCWFQCNRTKAGFLFVSELMQHSVWLQLLGVDEHQIADAKMRNIANDGKVTLFRGPNTG